MKKEEKTIDAWTVYLWPVLTCIGFIISVFVAGPIKYNEGQKDALLGKQKYEMKVLYKKEPYRLFDEALTDDQIDSLFRNNVLFVPVDTLIVKKK